MAILSCHDLRMAFGGPPVLDGATLHVERRDRIGLVGRNGEGKSTFLRILAGDLVPDDGRVVSPPGTRVGILQQEVPEGIAGTVRGFIAAGLSGNADQPGPAGHPYPDAHRDAHPDAHRVDRLGSILDIDLDADFEVLSGGQKRRALLGRALAGEPDVLLLDEPTNHLDIEGILWLEGFLQRFDGALVFITHDRAFLQRVADRVVELDRGQLTTWDCDYRTWLERREALLASEEKRWEDEDRVLAGEEAWIRQGIKARRTRNEGRVRALERHREQRAQRRTRIGTARIDIRDAEKSGRRVIVAEDVSFSYSVAPAGDEIGHEGEVPPLIRDFSMTITRGDRVGLVGPNGVGKTTLLRLMLGTLEPTSGTVEHGTSLQIAYFDQHREQLDGDATVAEAVAFGSDHVGTGDSRRHVMSYLNDFLFSPEVARQPIRALSGGERNRLLLARLFTKPANVLVLDEPTNDLDLDTLELLEARLQDFAGTVLVVSHDRDFLDNLCTSVLVFGDHGAAPGEVREHVGGYSDWRRVVERKEAEEERARGEERRRKADHPVAAGSSAPGGAGASTGGATSREGTKKLGFNEKYELEQLPDRIQGLEARLADAHERLADPDFYAGDPEDIRAVSELASELEAELDAAVERWAELAERA
jgi:ATP-binding cassette subfamily F protein uup